MSTTTKKQSLYPLHLVIGFGILALFWLLPPIDPITPLGMRCVGAFLCMVYLWSTVETMWPSLVGLFVLAISGYGGDGGFNGVWMNAIGADTVLLTLFAMVLMGGWMPLVIPNTSPAGFSPEKFSRVVPSSFWPPITPCALYWRRSPSQ